MVRLCSGFKSCKSVCKKIHRWSLCDNESWPLKINMLCKTKYSELVEVRHKLHTTNSYKFWIFDFVRFCIVIKVWQKQFYQVGVGVTREELVWVSVDVTVLTASLRIVVMIFFPLKMIGTSVDAVSVTVVTKLVVDSSVCQTGVGVTKTLLTSSLLLPWSGTPPPTERSNKSFNNVDNITAVSHIKFFKIIRLSNL